MASVCASRRRERSQSNRSRCAGVRGESAPLIMASASLLRAVYGNVFSLRLFDADRRGTDP